MKKSLLGLLCLMAVFGSTAYAEGIGVSFDDNAKTVSVSAQMGIKDTTVTLTIIKSGETVSKENTPEHMYLYKAGENGEIELNIPVEENIQSGRYSLMLDSTAGHESAEFLIVNSVSENTLEVIGAVNAAVKKSDSSALLKILTEQGEAVGIDTSIAEVSENLEYIAKYCCARAEEYTADGLLKAVKDAVLCIGINGGAGINEQNAAFLGISYEDYTSLDEAVRETVDLLIKKADFVAYAPDKAYAEALVTTKIRCAQSTADIKAELTAAASEIGIEIEKGSAFGKLGSTAQNKVYLQVYNERNSIEGYADAKRIFDAAVKANTITTGGGTGGDSGSSGSSSGVSGGNYVAPAQWNDEQTAAKTGFSDMDGHWSGDYVEKLAERKVVAGFSDNTFRPSQEVTRAEFVTMITALFKVNIGAEISFSDISGVEWYAESVKNAVGAGLVFGIGGKFRPNDSITRQDAAVIIYRLGERLNLLREAEPQFSDAEAVSGYAREAVSALAAAGIVNGSEGFFYPNNTLTRAESAVMLWKAFENRR